MLNKLMNKILGGTVNTTDNQHTAQVTAVETAPSAQGEQKTTRRRTNTRRPAGEHRNTEGHRSGEPSYRRS